MRYDMNEFKNLMYSLDPCCLVLHPHFTTRRVSRVDPRGCQGLAPQLPIHLLDSTVPARRPFLISYTRPVSYDLYHCPCIAFAHVLIPPCFIVTKVSFEPPLLQWFYAYNPVLTNRKYGVATVW
jgi:hypothetical protein